MKLLHREDVLEAGYDLPKTGLCANIAEDQMEELRFGGEWILTEDEVLVADGREQRYLYMVVSGEVAITKISDQGKTQQIAALGAGAAFGEMAFLSGGVASANVKAIGECILWRIDHERLLSFIGDHGVAGGQLCLNVASILSGRLVEGNKKVVDMGRELQSSLAQLQKTSAADSQKKQALTQMQGKVANMQNAFKGSSVQKSTNFFTIAASVVAVISTLGMIGLFVASDDSSINEAKTLAKKVDKLEANEDFYLGLKKRLEDENQELVQELKIRQEDFQKENAELAQDLSESMTNSQDLLNRLRQTEQELSEARDDLVRAKRPTAPSKELSASDERKLGKSSIEQVMGWAKSNSSLAFPLVLKLKNKGLTLQDQSGSVRMPVAVGESVRALRYHPSSPEFLVVAQMNSDKYLAVLKYSDSNFVDSLIPKYVQRSRVLGKEIPKDLLKMVSSENKPKPIAAPSSGSDSSMEKSISSTSEREEEMVPQVAKGRAMLPQKSEDLLDQLIQKEEEFDTSDHGANCVCKDCRAKKIGKGGSLFPDL